VADSVAATLQLVDAIPDTDSDGVIPLRLAATNRLTVEVAASEAAGAESVATAPFVVSEAVADSEAVDAVSVAATFSVSCAVAVNDGVGAVSVAAEGSVTAPLAVSIAKLVMFQYAVAEDDVKVAPARLPLAQLAPWNFGLPDGLKLSIVVHGGETGFVTVYVVDPLSSPICAITIVRSVGWVPDSAVDVKPAPVAEALSCLAPVRIGVLVFACVIRFIEQQ
jgi:hypothetical protein